MTGDEIWDEHRWEAFLRESDRRLDRYMDLLFGFMADNPPPETDDPEAREAWQSLLQAYIRARGLRFDEDFLLSLLFSEEEPGPHEDAWEAEADPYLDAAGGAADELGSFRDIDVYQRAFRLATEVLEWTDALPGARKDSTLVQFCTCVTQIPSNIAKGHGIGYERDMIGGNIACAKRGIAAANAALDLLREMKAGGYMNPGTYRRFYEQAYEVRNALGLYIQELRDQFNLGID